MVTYTPLYRKYRPQKFSEVIGQETVVKTLSNAVTIGRIAHAYLFTGPRGTGKTSTARIFAKSLNCVEGPTVNPCGKCPNCIDITNSNAVDVIEIDAASNRKVEDARNLLEKVQFVPISGKYKVYIIDEVHMLTTEAFNTLLKTLEEPPENLVFILATTESHKVLNTIISRCQRFDFRRMSQENIVDNLRQISQKENIKISDNALFLIAKKAFGGMRDAVGLLDQASVLSCQEKEISEKDIACLLGSLSEDSLFELTDCLAKKDVVKLIDLNQKVIQSCEPVNVIRELINYFKNLLIVKASKDLEKTKTLINFSESFLDELKLQSDYFEVNEMVQIIEKLSEYEKIIKTVSQQHIWLDIALINICHRQDIQVLKDMEERIKKLEEVVSSGKIPEVKSDFVPSPSIVKPELSSKKPIVSESKPALQGSVEQKSVLEEPGEKELVKRELAKEEPEDQQEPKKETNAVSSDVSFLWKKLLEKNTKMPSQTFFMNLAKPIEVSSERIVITFINENFVKEAQKEVKYNPLKEAALDYFKTSPQIIIRTPLPEDDAEKISKPSKERENAKQKENVSQKAINSKPMKVSQIAIDTDDSKEIDPEIIEKLDDINKPVTPVNVPEQAKMIIDVFSGKIIE